jgi:hypothetical protein
MKSFTTASLLAFVLLLLCGGALAAPLGTGTRAVLPAQIQQIVSVDYRALRNSPSGMALKNRVLPENLKTFENSLRGMGIDPDSDVEQLTFVAYRIKARPRNSAPKSAQPSTQNGDKSAGQNRAAQDESLNAPQPSEPELKETMRNFGVASGQFELKKLLARFKSKKVECVKYRDSRICPGASGFVVTFLDESTMVFGDNPAVQDALDVRDGELPGAASDPEISQMIVDAESAPVWSVLDQQGTQVMLRTVLGQAAALADYEGLKKRLLGSRYGLDLQHGVDFGLDVQTSDSFTAGTLSALLNAGMLYKRAAGNAAEKSAMEDMQVSSDSSRLELKFKADDSKFQALLKTDLFQAISH